MGITPLRASHQTIDVPKKVSLQAMLTLVEEFLHKGQRALSNYLSRFQTTVRKSIDATQCWSTLRACISDCGNHSIVGGPKRRSFVVGSPCQLAPAQESRNVTGRATLRNLPEVRLALPLCF